MKMVKSLLLGSAAGLAAVAGAQAADLPVKAKAVEYVKVCSAYGAGYYYIPGTDTCLKIGGYARFDTYINATGTFNPTISSVSNSMFSGPGAGVAGFPLTSSDTPDYATRARAVVDLDARTATDYGVLRSYARFGGSWDSWASSGTAGSSFYIERAFIQFAGFTFGYTQSFFDLGINYMYTTSYNASNQWTSLIAYTAQFGNGFSASIALEDAANRTTGIQATAATLSSTGVSYTNYTAGQSAPDIVANLRLDQAWGTAMISGALHQVTAMNPIGNAGTSYIGENGTDSWGWAIGGGIELKLPMLAPGDGIFVQASYADGALSYLGLSGSSLARATGVGSMDIGTTFSTALLSGAYVPLADAIWTGTTAAGDYSKVSGWSVMGQFRHFWLPNLRSSVMGGYTAVDVPTNTLGVPNVDVWQVGANTIWSPVRNLDLGLEVLYSKVDAGNTLGGNTTLTTTPISGSVVAPTGGSTDVWAGMFRAQRNF